jgi:Rrf2 family protein
MRINRRTDYAVRVLLALAKRPHGSRISTGVIQTEMLIPRPFLQRIIADLSKARLIDTYTGPTGGVQLARPAEEINLLHIWEAIEGPLVISDCLEESHECPLNPMCPVNARWARLQAGIIRILKSARLDEMAAEGLQKQAAAVPLAGDG